MANAVEASELAEAVDASVNEGVSNAESENNQAADVVVDAGDVSVSKDDEDGKEIEMVKKEVELEKVDEKKDDTEEKDDDKAVEKNDEEMQEKDLKTEEKVEVNEAQTVTNEDKDESGDKEAVSEDKTEEIGDKLVNDDKPVEAVGETMSEQVDREVHEKIEMADKEKDDGKANEKNDEEAQEKDEIKIVKTVEKVEVKQSQAVKDKDTTEEKVKSGGKDAVAEKKTEKVVDKVVKDDKPVEAVAKTTAKPVGRQVHAEIDNEVDEDLGDEEDDVEDEEERMVGEDEEGKIDKPMDDDQDRRNPQYIPKGGAFYEHDNRTSLEDVENKDPQETDKKKKSWKESKESERWLHDCYNESEQLPKSTAEIIDAYGYDIRNEDAPPRARRRRKYGRGPDKYERSWEDEQAYLVKQNNNGRRGKKKPFGKEEFPPLPNQKPNSPVSKPVQKSSPRRKEDEVPDKPRNAKMNGSDRSPTSTYGNRPSHSGNHSTLPGFHSNKKNFNHVHKKMNDEDIKPFRNDGSKWKNNNFKQGKQDDFPRPIRTQSIRQTDPPFRRSADVGRGAAKESDMSHITDGINQMTFHNRMANMRDTRPKTSNGPDESKMHEPEMDSPANRQNPKRYSKIRKGYTVIFPPEEVPELGQTEMHKLQQEQQKSQHINLTQPLNMQNVMKRYAGTYDFVPGNTSCLGARPIISGIPQQAMSPQGIPQQAMSPQVTGLQAIEIQQNPLAQQNFVPQHMYIGPHYPSDVMCSYSRFPPFSGNQTGDVYLADRGTTYYSPECQSSGQKLPPLPPRQNSAVPIIPPNDSSHYPL